MIVEASAGATTAGGVENLMKLCGFAVNGPVSTPLPFAFVAGRTAQ